MRRQFHIENAQHGHGPVLIAVILGGYRLNDIKDCPVVRADRIFLAVHRDAGRQPVVHALYFASKASSLGLLAVSRSV
ncbi:hypothetical protein SDC9_192470 [bioreactor metagenome]|uniref:Uncharacterized protein n=1 Tax=bioreactor metagenome TaxID=1076179 RepID=A0A645IBT8_9ZZZZ